jgi:F0F1-type ATP synthase assembly protein I
VSGVTAPESPKRTEQDEPPPSGRPSVPPVANWGLALDLGVRLGLSVVIGLGIGLVVDNWLHTNPAFTLVGLVLGVAAAFYTIWDVASRGMKR